MTSARASRRVLPTTRGRRLNSLPSVGTEINSYFYPFDVLGSERIPCSPSGQKLWMSRIQAAQRHARFDSRRPRWPSGSLSNGGGQTLHGTITDYEDVGTRLFSPRRSHKGDAANHQCAGPKQVEIHPSPTQQPNSDPVVYGHRDHQDCCEHCAHMNGENSQRDRY